MPDTLASVVAVDGKVKNVQSVLVQFVDHETDNLVIAFGDHADAIALPETADEIILGPRELETITFDAEHVGHIATNHPADVGGVACLCSLFHVGLPSGAMKIPSAAVEAILAAAAIKRKLADHAIRTKTEKQKAKDSAKSAAKTRPRRESAHSRHRQSGRELFPLSC